MSVLEWKTVELFELLPFPSTKLQNINADITAHCSSIVKAFNGTPNTTTVFCDINGFVHVYVDIDKNQKPISFKCQDSLKTIKLCSLTTNNLLTIVTQEEGHKFALSVYIYDLKNLSRKETQPCISSANVTATSAATSIQTKFMESERIFALAIGFQKGDIHMHFGKINRDVSLSIRRHYVGLSAINGLEFDENNRESEMKTYNLFVMCSDGIHRLVVNEKGTVESKIVLDSTRNSHSHCCTISKQIGSEPFFVVGRDDAVYCFTRDGRGPCYAIEGQKQFISWIGNHLVVVVKTQYDSIIICVDIEIKLTVFHKRMRNVICITNIDHNNLYYIVTQGANSTYNLIKLQEHNTTNKVKILLSKSMADNALRILERAGNVHSENGAFVRLQYGNNLMSKGSFSRAVKEYEQTLGVIRPYEIISKLLYSRHNDDLKQYLRKLTESKHSTIEQKKLLERCIDRENLSSRIDELWESRNDSNYICDFRQMLVRPINFSSLMNGKHSLETITTIIYNSNEDDIFNFFLENGKELLSTHSESVLKIVKELVDTHKIKDILRFLVILSDQPEFCANTLSDFLGSVCSVDPKLHNYLLALYLFLWHNQKISADYIHNFIKQKNLDSEMVKVMCKAYSFDIETGDHRDNSGSNILTGEDEKLQKCIEYHINRNPNLSPLRAIDPRSMLMILDKVCSIESTRISDIKNYFLEHFMKNAEDAKYEQHTIESLNIEIHKNGTQLSQFNLNPIEFRNKDCDSCRQPLQMPAIYFLCQHAFHKDCVRHNYNIPNLKDENSCFLCNDNFKRSESIKIEAPASSNIIEGISNVFASGMIKSRDHQQSYNIVYLNSENEASARSKTEHSNNPFDENYDSNYNIF